MQKKACLLFLLAFAVEQIYSAEVVCYFTNWAVYRKKIAKFKTSDIDSSLCTIINYAYVGLTTKGEIFELDSWSDVNLGNMKNVTNLKKKNSALKVLVSVGGWNAGSNNFTKVVSSKAIRSTFVDKYMITSSNALSFIRANNFDGLDIDWDYPTTRNGSTEDLGNFNELLSEIKEAFKSKGYLLTCSVMGAGSVVDAAYDVSKLMQHVDYLNLILFDLRVPTSVNYTAHHSPLYPCSLDNTTETKQWSVSGGIQQWLDKGAKSSQLILGIPMYGRSFLLKDSKQNGLYAPTKGPGTAGSLISLAGTLSYQEICKYYTNYTYVWDSDQEAPHAYSGTTWFSYDSTKSVALKAKYAKSKDLAGVMVWNLDYDDFNGSCGGGKYPLLNAIKDAL